METLKEKIDKLEEALIAAHRREEDLVFPPEWRQRLMEDLRRRAETAAPLDRVLTEDMVLRRMVFPFAAAASLAAVVLLLYTLTDPTGLDHQLTQLFLDDPTGLLHLWSFVV